MARVLWLDPADGSEVRECPVSDGYVGDLGELARAVHRFLTSGVLPVAGGWYDQPGPFRDALL